MERALKWWSCLVPQEDNRVIRCSKNKSGSYEIPHTLKTIDPYAFSRCKALRLIIIPYPVTEIARWIWEEARQGAGYVGSILLIWFLQNTLEKKACTRNCRNQRRLHRITSTKRGGFSNYAHQRQRIQFWCKTPWIPVFEENLGLSEQNDKISKKRDLTNTRALIAGTNFVFLSELQYLFQLHSF